MKPKSQRYGRHETTQYSEQQNRMRCLIWWMIAIWGWIRPRCMLSLITSLESFVIWIFPLKVYFSKLCRKKTEIMTSNIGLSHRQTQLGILLATWIKDIQRRTEEEKKVNDNVRLSNNTSVAASRKSKKSKGVPTLSPVALYHAEARLPHFPSPPLACTHTAPSATWPNMDFEPSEVKWRIRVKRYGLYHTSYTVSLRQDDDKLKTIEWLLSFVHTLVIFWGLPTLSKILSGSEKSLCISIAQYVELW